MGAINDGVALARDLTSMAVRKHSQRQPSPPSFLPMDTNTDST